MKRSILFASAGIMALGAAIPAEAQDGSNIVMRRPLNVSTGGADWKTTEFEIFDGSGNRITPSEACGNYELRRDVSCERNGQVVNDSFCRDAGAKPTAREPAFLDEGCTYTWNAGGWVDPGPSCTNNETQTQSVVCLRDLDNAPVDDSLCTETKPPVTRTVPDYSTCTYTWNESGFQDPGPACTPTETWTQDVSCRRDLDNVTVSDGLCTAAARPSETSIREDYSNCTYSWDTGEFVDPGQACTSSETQTRAVFCKRDLDDNVEADSRCNPSARPSATQSVADYSGCSYEWVQGAWQDPGASCTANEAQTRTVTCRRSDGTTVSDSECSGAKPATSQNVEDFSGCSYDWQTGAWSGWNNTCTTGGASRTRSVSCRRSDGTTVADSNCSGARPTASETGQSVYSGCSYNYVTGNWQDPGASCTANETQTRTVQCRRSNGENVSNSFCSGPVPASTQGVADYSGCSYAWQTGAWSGWSNTCTTGGASRSRPVSCRRSDGTTVADGNCGGGRPASSETGQSVYSGCSYSYALGNWQDPGASCTANETQTRTVQCRRSNGENVSNSFCSGPVPASTQSVADYSGCSYAWQTGNWSGWNSTCSPSATRTRTVQCRRSDGNTVSNASCGGGAPASSETAAIYSGCSPTQSWGAWSNWSSTCSNNATRSRTATCVSNGFTLPASECTSRGIQLSQSESSAIYSGCSYSAGYGAWATCSASGSQTRSMNSCRNTSLNNNVALSECTNRGMPATQSQSCTPPQTTGRTCSGTSIGQYNYYWSSGMGGNPGGSTGSWWGSGIYNTNPMISPGSGAILSRCVSTGGTCVRLKEDKASDYGNQTLLAYEYECFANPASPIGSAYYDSGSNGGGDWEVTERSFRP